MRKHILIVIILALFFVSGSQLRAQQPLDNSAVIKMVKAGLSADIVVATVNSQPGHYDLSPDGLIALKKAGASDAIISALIARNNGGAAPGSAAGGAGAAPAPAVATAPPDGITEVGVYYKDRNGAWTELLPEVVNFKSNGMLKSVSTVGMVRPNLNGHVPGSRAKLALSFPVTLAIYMPEGTAITEYQLLRLHINGDAREFRSVTGSAFHSNNGDARDNVEYQSEKIAPRVYQITLAPSFGRGEYGLLPPGGVSSSKTGSTGKLYTLSITE